MDKIDIQYDTVEFGEINTMNIISPTQLKQLSIALQKSGFELIDESNSNLIAKLKEIIIDLEKYSDEELKISFSDYIGLNVHDNFISLNKLFTEIEGITIEKYIIQRKIQMIKGLLVYNDFNLTEIAHKMHYINATELSRQFKRETGLTSSHFRELRHIRLNIPMTN